LCFWRRAILLFPTSAALRPHNFYTVPDLRNRYTQVVAPVGDLILSYTAKVDLDIFRADPTDELA
jgi:hypothetical protein